MHVRMGARAQGCRGHGVHRCRGAEVHRCIGAEVQRCRGAEVRGWCNTSVPNRCRGPWCQGAVTQVHVAHRWMHVQVQV